MLRKVLLALLLCITLTASLPYAAAEVHTLTASGEYEFTVDVDSPVTAREMARERARQSAVEMTGVYVKACTESQNFHITQDKVKVIAASILEITNEDIRMQPSADNKTIRILCTIQAKVDTDKIDLQRIAEEEANKEKIAAQSQRIAELEQNTAELNQQHSTLQVQAQRTEQERQALIAKYEQYIDIYDFKAREDSPDGTPLEIAQKLIALDPENTYAFRYMISYYRDSSHLDKLKSYCEQIIHSNASPQLKINACLQLGELYYSNDEYNIALAKTYVDMGINLAKTQYSPATIDHFVNGSNATYKRTDSSDLIWEGKSNPLRELYLLKNSLEEYPPSFVYDFVEGKEQFYNIHYKVDW